MSFVWQTVLITFHIAATDATQYLNIAESVFVLILLRFGGSLIDAFIHQTSVLL